MLQRQEVRVAENDNKNRRSFKQSENENTLYLETGRDELFCKK